ncbi:MAG: PaaI family thioesterase [Saprospiraceae bacterium]|nr:PaaI family thioesterase [Saprospiraceae bacterium]
MKNQVFQHFMSDNVCFGCGSQHPDGLRIESYWDGDLSVCTWTPQDKYAGWKGLLNGGILATLVDCHCMGTAIADAYRREGRSLDSDPVYRYATGTISVKYLKPTPLAHDVLLVAKVTSFKGRKTELTCDVYSNDVHTATASVVAIRVFDSSDDGEKNAFGQ